MHAIRDASSFVNDAVAADEQMDLALDKLFNGIVYACVE